MSYSVWQSLRRQSLRRSHPRRQNELKEPASFYFLRFGYLQNLLGVVGVVIKGSVLSYLKLLKLCY